VPPYLPPEQWHATLPGVIAAAAAVIGDGDGRVLLVKPNYRDHWALPGGVCERGESPHAACAREVTEELGLVLKIGRLLAVDWSEPEPAYGPDARPVVRFIFDGGTLHDVGGITLQADELDDWRFVGQDQLAGYLPAHILARTVAALRALGSGGASYVPDASS
jgi:8-oxo-dGTP diphosphatase